MLKSFTAATIIAFGSLSLSGCGSGSAGSSTAGPVPTPAPTPTVVVDADRDGVEDALDNCVMNENRSQSDVDRDGVGDVCDIAYDQIVAAPPGGEYSAAEGVVVGFFMASDQAPVVGLDASVREIIEGTQSEPGVRELMRRYSHGAANYPFEYLGWMTLPHEASFYEASVAGRTQQLFDAFTAFKERGHDSVNKKYILIVNDVRSVPGESSPCRGGGIWPADWAKDVGFAMIAGVNASCLTRHVVAHELLHASGLSHAEASQCESFLEGAPQNVMTPGAGDRDCLPGQDAPDVLAYFSEDVMGGGDGHPSAPKKVAAGWIQENLVERVSSETVVELDAQEYASIGRKAAFVPIGQDDDLAGAGYWVEYRADADPNAGTYTGVYIRDPETQYVRIWFSGVGASPYNEEWPYATSDYTFKSAQFPLGLVLADGESFHDPYRGIRIERVSSRVDNGLPKTTLRISKSHLLSGPDAVALVRPGKEVEVSFRNKGGEDVALLTAELAGRDSGRFDIVLDSCGMRTLASGEQCTVVVHSTDRTDVETMANVVVQIETSDALRPKANQAIRMLPKTYPDPTT